MKKLVLFGVIVSFSGLSGQAVLADVKVPEPEATINAEQQLAPSWLGVWIENIPMSLGSHLSTILKKNQGVMVRKVSPDSPAGKAGLLPYDIISGFNDQEIFSQQQLTRLIQTTPAQTTVKLTIVRHSQLMTQEVVLKASPAQRMPTAKPYHHYSPFAPHHGTGRGLLPPPWMRSPFFHPNFNPGLNQGLKQQHQSRTWSQFESIQIESTGKDNYRAKVKYEDGEGNNKEFIFEGNLAEIRQQILKQDDMTEDKKQSLLQALDMKSSFAPPPFGANRFMQPDWFNQPAPLPHGFKHHK